MLSGSLPFIHWSLSGMGSPAAAVLAPWFQFQCHGLAERTLALGGRDFPVCSRCLGIYSGLLMAALVARPLIEAARRRLWIIAAAGFMVMEVLVQDLTRHPPYHLLRMLTGILLAWPVALTLMHAAPRALR